MNANTIDIRCVFSYGRFATGFGGGLYFLVLNLGTALTDYTFATLDEIHS